MRRSHVTLVAAIAAIALVAATASLALGATRSVTVRKAGSRYHFAPATLSIRKGDTVRWSWSGSTPHNVTGPGFHSRTASRLTYSRRFTRAGTFRVVCTIHKALGQRMRIVVR
jgi:plastocyanin